MGMMSYMDNIVTLLVRLKVNVTGKLEQVGIAVSDTHESLNALVVWIQQYLLK